jgi:hypothetical protein
MRRWLMILGTALIAVALLASTSCRKEIIKDTPEEDQPDPGPQGPPGPR